MRFRALLVSLTIIPSIWGCDNSSLVVFSEFSDEPITISTNASGSNVVGFNLKTEGSISDAVTLQLGFEGKIYKSIKIPENGVYAGRFDWYNSEAELTFLESSHIEGELRVEYEFLTL